MTKSLSANSFQNAVSVKRTVILDAVLGEHYLAYRVGYVDRVVLGVPRDIMVLTNDPDSACDRPGGSA